MVQKSWNLSPALMRKSSEREVVVDRSGAVQPKPQKAPEQAKLQEISKRMRRLGNSGTPSGTFGPPPFGGDTAQQRVKVVGETTAETMSLLSASIESICADGGNNNNSNNNNKHNTSGQIVVDHGGTKVTKSVSGGFSGFQYHILAVDDSHVDQMVIEKLLKVSAYRVTTVNSALRALEVLGLSDSPASSSKKVDIDLIMTDYCMPEMSGYDLLKRVKAKTSAWKEIPVVVMSSENDSNRIKRCLAEGAEEFIIKPVQMADVKQLQGYIRPTSPTSTSGTTWGSSSSSTCGKRKAMNRSELHEVTSPERQTS